MITRPDTPLPWLNYLGQDDFFGLCTNCGGGYTFYRDAKLRRLTRYRYNEIPYDNNGRYLYVKDGDSIWCPTWKPVRTPLDRYECRHGLGYNPDTGKEGTLLDHLELSIRYCLDNCGPHGLPLIGHADWNDCLNLNCFSTEPNESFQLAAHGADDKVAESVMIAGLILIP